MMGPKCEGIGQNVLRHRRRTPHLLRCHLEYIQQAICIIYNIYLGHILGHIDILSISISMSIYFYICKSIYIYHRIIIHIMRICK